MRCAEIGRLLSLVFVAAAFGYRARAAVTSYSNKSTFLSAAGQTLLESFETVADRPLAHSAITAPLLTLTPISSNSDAALSSDGGSAYHLSRSDNVRGCPAFRMASSLSLI